MLPNGDLVAGGDFTNAGDAIVNYIARWDGVNWHPIGTGFNFPVWSLAVMPNGDLVAGGQLTLAGSIPVNRIARWDGSNWSALGTGMTYPGGGSRVYALAVLPTGDLIAGGYFRYAGGIWSVGAARWDGTAWNAMGLQPGTDFCYVNALAALPGGDLVAGGYFLKAGGVTANHIARWDGVQWFPFGTGVNDEVAALDFLPNGNVLAGGAFSHAGGADAQHIARWTGSNWIPMGTGTAAGVVGAGTVFTIAARPIGEIVVGGEFAIAGSRVSAYIARWSDHPCYANCDCSTSSPSLNIADFTCYLSKFATGDPYANCDNSMAPPTLNVADFTCFMNRFAAGCP